ncbi:threonyl-tRNA synthetase [Deinobacterium chartae]|uniref:Threonine--tRNA ligase n=1 Tax=Deinobacterium chartae TaxID=521158 RepID=A0A841HWU4_9DEIO|nr:threonine--tRNA ligase [Deinobacterium chartae]MBB6097333.1 threonyl-tRNA synthetase [Deinobacterium chartae]
MQIALPDGQLLELPQAAAAAEVAARISPRLAREGVAARVNDALQDLMTPLPEGARVQILTRRDLEEAAPLWRHTLAHVMSQAVGELYRSRGFAPEALRRGVGPVIENGFYQDFDLPEPLSEEDLPELERRMHDIVSRDLEVSRVELDREEALARFAHDPYKQELIRELPDGVAITVYQQGDYADLCRGPHVPRTGLIPRHFKLMSTSGAYWRGSEQNPMLQRVYGVAFASKAELDAYLHRLEEARRRDHRRIGKELELFTFSDEVGQGLPLWLPKGAFVRRQLEQYMFEREQARGYEYVITPHLAREALYLRSGHLPYYAGDLYAPIDIDGELYYLKPMNCPHHHAIYAARPRSYRELPLRLSEFGTCYRYEMSGALSGLQRVRGFTQNDAHIYCSRAQVKDEFIGVIEFFQEVYADFGIEDYGFRLSLPDFEGHPQKFGERTPEWDESVAALRAALEETGVPFVESLGDAAFYGPKLDVQVRTVIGREETIATNQLDFIQPGRFDLTFMNERGEREVPVVIHRAIMGSFDRFFAFLLEHTAGYLPLWLVPQQVAIIPISDRHLEYAREVEAQLRRAGVRARTDAGSERMNAKVRAAELAKIPVMVIVGDQEVASRTVSVRGRALGERQGMPPAELAAELGQQGKPGRIPA